MKCSGDRVIKSRHKGLSRKEFNRGGVGILLGEVWLSRTLLDCRRFTGPQPLSTASIGYTHSAITHAFLSAQFITLNS